MAYLHTRCDKSRLYKSKFKVENSRIDMFVVISYDISEDSRRTKIHKILKSYGQWMQYSVFECDLTTTQYAKLRSRLAKMIKPEQDSIRFYFLCGCCQPKIERIGGEIPMDTTVFFA